MEGSSRRWRGVRAPALLAGAVLAAALLLHLRDPHRSGTYGVCPWLLLTGCHCPGCGGLRAAHDLAEGDLVGAASSNLLLVTSLPLMALGWVRWVVGGWRGTRSPWPVRRLYGGVAVGLATALVFAVARNLPAGSWLAP